MRIPVFFILSLVLASCQFNALEKECFPGTAVCVEGQPGKIRICSVDGMLWETRTCDPDHQCQSGRCVANFQGNVRILTDILPDGDGDHPYSFQLEASGGQQPYAWQILSGSLPSGLMLDSSGMIHGVPLMPGEFSLRLRVFDSSEKPGWSSADSRLVIHMVPLEVIGDNVVDILVAKLIVLPFIVPYVEYDVDLLSKGGLRPHFWREATPPSGLATMINQWGLPSGLTLTMSPGRISGTVQSTADAATVVLPNGTRLSGYFLYLRTTDSQDPPDSVQTVFMIPTIPLG